MFSSIISLGWFCGTSASLSKYGFRSFSGPFDWYFSEFTGVLDLIKTDFSGFLLKENIVSISANPKEFIDIQYHLHFNHDINNTFEDDFPIVKEKYSRRIQRFQSEIKKGVCFIRAVKNQEEIAFISKNHDYIISVLTKSNNNNTIIYLIPKYLVVPQDFNEIFFILNINVYQGNYREGLRGLFDTVEDKTFIKYLKDNYANSLYKDNLIFDLQAELNREKHGNSSLTIELQAIKDIDHAYRQVQINETRCQSLIKLHRTNVDKLSLPMYIDIYGAGDIGKVFYDKIKELTTVRCFIDKNPCDSQYDNIPIIQLMNYEYKKNTKIIVIPTYALEEIRNDLSSICNVELSNIIPLESVL